MIVDFSTIYKNDLFSIKIEIYYKIIKVIIKNRYNYNLINIINKIKFFYLLLANIG